MSPGKKDLLFGGIAAGALTFAIGAFDPTEHYMAWTSQYEHANLDDFLFGASISLIILLFFLLARRYREARNEHRRLQQLKSDLRIERDTLELRVADRTRELSETNTRQIRILHELDLAHTRTAALTNTFIQLGADPERNIDILVKAAGSILEAACATYHRTSETEASTYWCGYNAPTSLHEEDAARTVCRELAEQGARDILILPDLHASLYGKSDASIDQHGLRSYLGHPVRLQGQSVGTLSIMYMQPRHFSPAEVEILATLAKGISLAEERSKITGRLLEARTAAEAASVAKSEFLANMSHEIRTPLNGMLGMIQLTLLSELTPEQKEYVSAALDSGKSLLTVINDILDFSKIEAGKMALKNMPFQPRAILEKATKVLQVQAREQGNKLSLRVAEDVPLCLSGDEGRFRQVFFNLVGNALKFTQDGRVDVELSSLLPTPDGRVRLLFCVLDTGCGIPEDKIEGIVEPFAQADGSFRKNHQGTGLGLSIVAKMARLMNGSLSLESEEGIGTTVCFSALFDSAVGDCEKTATEEQEEQASPSLPPLRLLLAEDNRVNRIAPQRFLERQGHSVICAASGAEVLDKLRSVKFDAVFMDIQMPDMDGLEAMRRIRRGDAGPENKNVPVIALTAHALDGYRENFLDAGMDGYLSKPVSLRRMEYELARVLNPDARKN